MSKSIPNIIARIEADHDRLGMVKRSLARFVEDEDTGDDFLAWKIEALFQVRDFRNRVAKHFDLEEQGGFFAELLRLAPHAARRIEGIESDHGDILDTLDGMIEWLKRIESADEATRQRLQSDVSQVMEQLRAHESSEHEMMFSAHNQVFGAGD